MFKKDTKIAVIGDVMLDTHVSCEVLGLSPEDDVALKIKEVARRTRPGGAANVILNLRTLGCLNVHLFGTMGNDEAGKELIKFLTNGINPNLYVSENRPTTTKTRYISPKGRQVVRIDYEEIYPIDDDIIEEIINKLEENSPYDAIVVSDYGKGMISKKLCKEIHCCSPLILVDPKGNDLLKYGPVYAMTPNEREWGTGKPHEAYNLVITRGKRGCVVDTSKMKYEWPVREREVGDATGCGDSFIAGLTMALISKYNINDACKIGMAVAACVVDHEGAYAVPLDELDKELKSFNYIIPKPH